VKLVELKILKKIEFVLFGLIYYIFILILRSKTIIIMPNANSVRSSSSNNQNMAINQDFLRSISGGDGICARELYNNINNQNMEINQESIARELYNYFNIQNMEMNQGSFRQVTGAHGHTASTGFGVTGAHGHTASTGFGVTGPTGPTGFGVTGAHGHTASTGFGSTGAQDHTDSTGFGVTGATGHRIYGRELHNRNRNSNQHTETNDEIDDRINRLVNNSINRMRERVVRMDNTPSICVISNPPYPNNSETSRRE
jgi:hypothetical protein